MNLRDLVGGTKSSEPYAQTQEQRESGYLKEFLEYQKQQQEEAAAYSLTSQADINRVQKDSRYLIQPATNQNKVIDSQNTLVPSETSFTKDKDYNFQSLEFKTTSKEYEFNIQNYNLIEQHYDFKTSDISLSDTSQFYKKLFTSDITHDSSKEFYEIYGDLSTLSLKEDFEKGENYYTGWKTFTITPEEVFQNRILVKAHDGGVISYANTQNNSSFDYYSLAYQNRSIVPAIGNTDSVYISTGYNYNELLSGSLEGFKGNTSTIFSEGITYPHAPVNGTYFYNPLQLKDDIWNLYSKSPMRIEKNWSEVGIYNPDGAWLENEQSFINRMPLLGDIQQRLSDLEGSSILWQAFYNKKSSDPTQIYKIAAFNSNVINMTGRFVPMPPGANDLRFTLAELPIPALNSVVEWLGALPSYPYIPLPNAVPKYKIFTVPQMVEEADIWKSIDVSTYMIKSKWELLKDLEDRESQNSQKGTKPSFYPSQFGYDQIKDFEGHVTVYDLQIVKPSSLDAAMPDFVGDKEGSWAERPLSAFTTITEIPEAEIKTGSTYQLGEFGTFLLSLSYMDYVAAIKTSTRETAECDCYKWGKAFIKWMYDNDKPSKYRHRSIYKSYYNIIISKIYYKKSPDKPIARIIESRTFHGVPSFNLTEPINDQKLQEFQITWNIIGHENVVTTEQFIVNDKATSPSIKVGI